MFNLEHLIDWMFTYTYMYRCQNTSLTDFLKRLEPHLGKGMNRPSQEVLLTVDK